MIDKRRNYVKQVNILLTRKITQLEDMTPNIIKGTYQICKEFKKLVTVLCNNKKFI